jgi:glycosyltransferase involved in cell wall biosynthesis
VTAVSGIATDEPSRILVTQVGARREGAIERLTELGLAHRIMPLPLWFDPARVERRVAENIELGENDPNLRLHRDLISGKRRAIGWGAGGLAPAIMAVAPYCFDTIVDSAVSEDSGRTLMGVPIRPVSVLRSMNPETCGIVSMTTTASPGHLAREASAFGAFHVTSPWLPARDGPVIADSCMGEDDARASWRDRLRNMLEGPPRSRTIGSDRVSLWIPGLDAGGAERQMVVLALALRKHGWEVELVSARADRAPCTAWTAALEQAGVSRHILPAPRTACAVLANPDSLTARRLTMLAHQFEPLSATQIAETWARFEELEPDVVISYLDHANIVAGVAAILAGVPRVLLSARSVSPENFPRWNKLLPTELRRMPEVYRALLDQDGVKMAANSTLGARSYERWLGAADNTIMVVPNAVMEPIETISQEQARRRLGIPQDALVVVGVMRLASEKDPLTWISVLARLASWSPKVLGIIVGDGELGPEVSEAIASSGAADRFRMAGRTSDVGTFLTAGNLLLLTSLVEGMPNVVLEAQAHGTPVVATDVGATREATAPVLQHLLCRPQDVEGMFHACQLVLQNPAAGRALGEIARQATLEAHSPHKLASATLAALGLEAQPTRRGAVRLPQPSDRS